MDIKYFPDQGYNNNLCERLLDEEDIISLPDIYHFSSSGSTLSHSDETANLTVIAAKPKRKRKKYLANAFPRIIKRDIRRFMAQMFLNMYNANDNSFTSGLFHSLCIPTCSTRYFVGNQVVSKVKGINKMVDLAMTLTGVHPVDIVFSLQGCQIKQYKDSKVSQVEFDVVVKGTNLIDNLQQAIQHEPFASSATDIHAQIMTQTHAHSQLHALHHTHTQTHHPHEHDVHTQAHAPDHTHSQPNTQHGHVLTETEHAHDHTHTQMTHTTHHAHTQTRAHDHTQLVDAHNAMHGVHSVSANMELYLHVVLSLNEDNRLNMYDVMISFRPTCSAD
ncbi:hypothetical protein EON65_48670 [archaeon]|nr:MAG: hypothetical protein EON65_48670 [archaeon]